MITVVSGIRDLAESDYERVREAVIAEARYAHEFRFGGALGVDTVALKATWSETRARKVVYVPFTLRRQPKEARAVIERCADEVIELRLGDPSNKAAYIQRNRTMLSGLPAVAGTGLPGRHLGVTRLIRGPSGPLILDDGQPAQGLLAFTDGRKTGGTARTIEIAKEMKIHTDIVTVASTRKKSS